MSDSCCSVKSCQSKSAGSGARTPRPLCHRHLAQDTERVRELQSCVQKRLQLMKLAQERARMQQLSLAAELQETEEQFHEVLDSLMKWKESVMSRLTARHDSALQEMRKFAAVQEYESAMGAAETAGDLRVVFELTSEMEMECSDFEERLRASDAASVMTEDRGCAGGGQRVVGDVSGRLRDLQLLIDRCMRDVMQLCESGKSLAVKPEVSDFQLLRKIEDLGAKPVWLTSCNNTDGFVGDSSGRVMKRESAGDGGVKLPKTCLFVSFIVGQMKDHLLVLSVDGSVRLRCHCDIDWTQYVCGLHCDSQRQLLFVSQREAVTVTDLSGRVSRVMNSSSLGQSVGCFCGIDGNSDKVFVFDGEEKKVLGIGKDSGELQTVIRVDAFCGHLRCASGLALLGNKILLADSTNGQVHKVCIVSKQLISSFPADCKSLEKFKGPVDVAVGSNGLIFISEVDGDTVRILSSDGALLQTLDSSNACGLAVVPGDPAVLAVADWRNSQMSIFSLSC